MAFMTTVRKNQNIFCKLPRLDSGIFLHDLPSDDISLALSKTADSESLHNRVFCFKQATIIDKIDES